MLLEKMNWMDVEEHLKKDDRLVLVTGSVEEHGYYSVATDAIVPFEIAKAACEVEGVVLAPAQPYGVSPGLMAYPGTVSLDPRTYLDLVHQILKSFVRHGFKRIFVLNGHGENTFAEMVCGWIREENPEAMVKWRQWYSLPNVVKFQVKHGGHADHHAAWIELFPWINQVGPQPDGKKEDADYWVDYFSYLPEEVKERFGDGVTGGFYSLDEEIMREYFKVAVDDVLDILRGDW
jgi:creatinine amidohydrolase